MLYIVRHGQTPWNEKKLAMGRQDILLNETGIRQAKTTRDLLKDIDIDLIISSPLIRARQTANIINQDKQVEMILDDRLTERGLGELEGKEYTEDNDRFWDIRINTSDYGVETMEELKTRVYSFIEDMKENYEDKNVLVVTHGGVSAMMNAYFNNTLYEGPISNKFLTNCSIAEYDQKTKIK